MGRSAKNKLILFLTCIFSIFAVTVAGISTFAWFQQTFSYPDNVNQGIISSGANDLEIDGVTGYKYVYDDTGDKIDYSSGHVASYGAEGTDVMENISQDDVDSGADVPTQGVGYYAKGDENFSINYGEGRKPWSYASAVRLEDKYGGNKAVLKNIHFSLEESISLWHYYFTDSTHTTDVQIATLGESNSGNQYLVDSQLDSEGKLVFGVAGTYNIYINSQEKIYIQQVSADPLANSLSRASIKKTQSTVDNKNYTKLIVNETSCDWDYNTLWLDNLGFTGGYTVDDFEYFASQYYGTQDNNMDASSTTRSRKRYINGFNLCAGGSGTVHEYILPPWLSYCSISIQTSRSGSYNINVNYLNNLAEQAGHNQYNEYMYGKDSGLVGTGKTVTFKGYYYNDLDSTHRPNGYNGWNSIIFLTSIDDNEDDYSWTTNTVSVSYVDSTGSTISDLSGSSSQEINCNLYSVNTYTDTGTYTFSGVYYSRTNSFASKTSTSSGSKLRVENGFTIFVVYVIPTYYTMHILKWNYPVASQPDPSTWSTYSASSWASFTGEVTYSVTKNTNTPFNTSTTPDTSKYSTSKYTWCNVWYTYDGNNYSAIGASTNVAGSTSSGSPTHLYTYVVEKTVTLNFYKSTKYGTKNNPASATASYGSYNNENWNLKSPYDTTTNSLTWGVAGSFTLSDYVNDPTYDTTNYAGIGWSDTTANDNVDTTYTSGTPVSITSDKNFYYRIKEAKRTIAFEKRYFLNDGTPYTGPSTSITGTAAVFNSSGAYTPSITVADVARTDNSNSYSNAFYVFQRNNSGKLYTHESCEEEYLYTGPINGADMTLYVKMVAKPTIILYFVKPGNDNNKVLSWYHVYAYVYYKDGANIISPKSSETTNGNVLCKYIDAIGYYTCTIPTDAYFHLYGLNQDGSVTDLTTTETCEIGLSLTDYNGKTRTTENVIQLWDNNDDDHHAKWSWRTTAKDQFYIVGKNLTSSIAPGSDPWDTANGIELLDAGVGTDYPDDLFYRKNVYLSNDVVFKIYNALGEQWLGATSLASGDTLDYVTDQGPDPDNNNEYRHNIVMMPNVKGYFNIYVDSNRKIHVEDATKAGYLFFTDPVGNDGLDTIQMGAGDDTYHSVVLNYGLYVRKGDTFALRNRRKGLNSWYYWDDLESTSYAFIENSTFTLTSDSVKLGDADSYTENGHKLITFKTSGYYNFYLTCNQHGIPQKIRIEVGEQVVSDGYFIMENSSDTAFASLDTTNAIKLRSLPNSTKNRAVYTGFHVVCGENESYKKFSVFSLDENNENIQGYTKFHDGAKERGDDPAIYDTVDEYNIYQSSGSTVKLNPGYYNIYIYYVDGGYTVSFARYNTGSFFKMNAIQYGINTANGVKASNTSIVLRVAFTYTGNNTSRFTIANIADTSTVDVNGTQTAQSFHSYLKYAYILNPVGIDNVNQPNPYMDIRDDYYDNMHAYSASPVIRTIVNNDIQDVSYVDFAGTTSSGRKYYLYILIDYNPSTLGAHLVNEAEKNANFKFVLKTTQVQS